MWGEMRKRDTRKIEIDGKVSNRLAGERDKRLVRERQERKRGSETREKAIDM